jgi:hypothetical protein
MTEINKDNLATLEFQLTWTSDVGKHTEIYHAEHVNFWRDVLPQEVYEGENSSSRVIPGEYSRYIIVNSNPQE